MTYHYDTLNGKVVRQSWDGNTLDIIYDANGSPYACWYNNTYCHYILNQQGDVIRMTLNNGTIMAEYQYDAWGNVISKSGELADINPIRYRGYFYDSETGFYYLQSRYYDPSIGRFINADSFASTGQGFLGYNMFAYCNNNPVMYVDNFGSAPWPTTVVLRDGMVDCDGPSAMKSGRDIPDEYDDSYFSDIQSAIRSIENRVEAAKRNIQQLIVEPFYFFCTNAAYIAKETVKTALFTGLAHTGSEFVRIQLEDPSLSEEDRCEVLRTAFVVGAVRGGILGFLQSMWDVLSSEGAN